MTDRATHAQDHRGLAVLSLQECLERLTATAMGRVAFAEAGGVVIFPVNYVMDGLDVVFRSAYGTKLGAADDGRAVAFEIDAYEPEEPAGWSVLVQGVARIVADPVALARYRGLSLRPALGDGTAGDWITIRADQITGRAI